LKIVQWPSKRAGTPSKIPSKTGVFNNMAAALEPTDLLAAEPAVLTNIKIGYAR
jgi:hypothetical protein